MRDYGTICPAYWIGQTGRKIRAMGRGAQLIGTYLLTCPNSNLIGLYYLPLVILAHETNCTVEEARMTLDAMAAIDWAYYDHPTETVWVRNMAFYQVAEEIKNNDNRWGAILRELVSYNNSPFYSKFLEVYGGPFNLVEALEAPHEALGSPSEPPSKGLVRANRKRKQAPSKGLTRPSQAPPKPLASPSEGPSNPLPSPLQAPSEPLGSPSEARSIEHRAEAKSKEQKQGAPGEDPEGHGARVPTEVSAAAASIPAWIERDLKALSVSGPYLVDLFKKLGRNGVQCAIYKIRSKPTGRNPPGLLLSRGAELATEGRSLLQEAVKAALQGAPEAFRDPRWAKQPQELRADLEVQETWARWLQTEKAMVQASGGPGAEEAQQLERGARKPLLQILQDRHPEPETFRARYERELAGLPQSGLTGPAMKLLAMTAALDLTTSHGGKP